MTLLKFMRPLAAAAVLAFGGTAASAATVTLDLSSFTSAPSVTVSNAGLSLTVDNGIDGDGAPINIRNALGGMAFSDAATAVQATFTFSKAVQLVSYVVANEERDGDGAFFNLTQGLTSTSSTNNPVDALGTFAFTNTVDFFAGGLGITFLGGDGVGGLSGGNEFEAFSLSSITVQTIPLPLPAALLLTGLFGLGVVSRFKSRA
ncbi:MAG: hypothetical protein AAF557_04525 [Pseudomonadota bacterium]